MKGRNKNGNDIIDNQRSVNLVRYIPKFTNKKT